MKVYAVVTGDIKNFTTLDSRKREKLVVETEGLLQKMVGRNKDAQMFRGDSYQFILEDISQVLKKCIQLICWFKLNSERETPKLQKGPIQFNTRLGTRLSIGIGEIAYEGKNVLDSDGEAFHFSGRVFDEMDKGDIIRLTTFDEDRTNTYQIILMYINLIVRQWTISQAETIYQLLSLEDGTQDKIAKQLNMSQPAVANSLRSARWKEVEKGINFISKELEKQYLI
ncbi:MAG: hypothetical protein JWQ66_2319 [Mucilaginibacter sp.]|nr:hypothetical protein [Mucilaginibacter sp.]